MILKMKTHHDFDIRKEIDRKGLGMKYLEISDNLEKNIGPIIYGQYKDNRDYGIHRTSKDQIKDIEFGISKSFGLQLPQILYCLNNDLKNKRILDLGCGSYPSTDGICTSWQPWLCRTLMELGSKPIGIDIGNLSFEEFEHYQLDLTKPGVLDFLPDNSIDLANASQLVNSPYLNNPLRNFFRGGVYLLEILKPQLERIVKPEGVLLYSDDKIN